MEQREHKKPTPEEMHAKAVARATLENQDAANYFTNATKHAQMLVALGALLVEAAEADVKNEENIMLPELGALVHSHALEIWSALETFSWLEWTPEENGAPEPQPAPGAQAEG